MKGLILAGGKGTRLRPLTINTPKPVVPVANSPFLLYQIDLMRSAGIQEIILSLSYQPRKIEDLLKDGSDYGLVETTRDGWIQRFIEKPGPDEVTCNTINAGIYVLEPSVLRYIPKAEPYSFERGLFPTLLERKEAVLSFILDQYWIDIGTPQKYLEVHQDILSQKFVSPRVSA